MKIGSSLCTVSSVTNTQIQCTAGANTAGDYTVYVKVISRGYANLDKLFTYSLSLSSASHSDGKQFKYLLMSIEAL